MDFEERKEKERGDWKELPKTTEILPSLIEPKDGEKKIAAAISSLKETKVHKFSSFCVVSGLAISLFIIFAAENFFGLSDEEEDD